MSKTPFLSIVIANYNYGKMLPTAIESVLHQDCDDYELIIVDGGSTDNSVDVIKSYEQSITWWVSEPDKGQSDAFNKGFIHSKGEFLTWLNADDVLLPGTIKAVKNTIVQHPGIEWATGNFVRFESGNNRIVEALWGPHHLPSWLQGKGRPIVYYGPTTFWSRNLYDKYGPIDERLHLAMDIDYWMRLNNAGVRQVRVNHYCWGFRMHADSKTAYMENQQELRKLAAERELIYEKNNYHPYQFWRIVGWGFRLFDGSIINMILKKRLIGRKIEKVFNIEYPI